MREVIITDLTRFSTDEFVCIAVIDRKTGECFRPLPYITNENCKNLDMHPGAIMKGDINFQAQRLAPHIEDAIRPPLTFSGKCSGTDFKDILDKSLSNSVSEGFNFTFTPGQKHIPHDKTVDCSIITIEINPKELTIHEDSFNPGKIKASFTDNQGQKFSYLPIADRGFHDYAKKHQNDGKLNDVTEIINNQNTVYLRIGLGRVHKVPDGRNGYWLQVNGIYTYPDFHKEIRTYG